MNENSLIISMMNEMSVPSVQKQRQGIMELEKVMLEQDQVEIEPEHLVHAGMYIRKVTVPAGTLLTGQIYKFDHIEMMVSGLLVVTTDDGKAKVLDKHCVMPAFTGKKRAAYALEETTWLTIHSVGDTKNLTPDEIQETLTSETWEDLEQFYNEVNRADYAHFLMSQGWSEEQVRKVVEDTTDYTDALELEHFGVSIGDSNIQGSGMFAEKHIVEGEFIMPARLREKRTQAGRFINHAVRPNAKFVFDGTDLNTVAIRDIHIGEEITVNYRDTLEMRHAEGDLCQE